MAKRIMKLGLLQQKWVDRLKKYPERQMTSQLGRKGKDGTYRACCLGEAGLMLRTCKFNKEGVLFEKGSKDELILVNSYKKLGLNFANGRTIDGTESLAGLNDSPEHTWMDIALMIENAPELFFTKSI